LTGGVAVERARSADLLRVDVPFPVKIPVDRLLATRRALKAEQPGVADL
jgi:hypothetical protein